MMLLIKMAKLAFHPNAYLMNTRNVKRGLISRTRILFVLERKNATASILAKESELSYNVVLHHLHLLEGERIVSGVKKEKPFLWKSTGLGQQSLTST